MASMITYKTYKALKCLEQTKVDNPMSAHLFAHRYWDDDEKKRYLFTAVSYGDNGAVSGKKAWLCAGSLLSKLAKRGLAMWLFKPHHGYTITSKGLDAIREYEQQNNI